jgi:3-oxoacyl-[acyl-carrier-protein] synthase II
MIPPTLNLSRPDPSLPAELCDFVAGAAQRRPVDVALSNSFGFGGTNCSLLFTRPPSAEELRAPV